MDGFMRGFFAMFTRDLDRGENVVVVFRLRTDEDIFARSILLNKNVWLGEVLDELGVGDVLAESKELFPEVGKERGDEETRCIVGEFLEETSGDFKLRSEGEVFFLKSFMNGVSTLEVGEAMEPLLSISELVLLSGDLGRDTFLLTDSLAETYSLSLALNSLQNMGEGGLTPPFRLPP